MSPAQQTRQKMTHNNFYQRRVVDTIDTTVMPPQNPTYLTIQRLEKVHKKGYKANIELIFHFC